MDEEQNPKVNPNNFFESIERVDKVANNALERTRSNLSLIENNQSLIDNLTKSIQSIQSQIQQLTNFLILQQDEREKDLDKQADLLAAREDQEQKRRRSETLSGKGGDGDGGISDKSLQEKINEAVTSTPSILALGGILAMLMSSFLKKDDGSELGKNLELTSPEQLESAKNKLEDVKAQREAAKDMPAGKEKRELLDSTKEEILQLEKKIKNLEKTTGKDTQVVDDLLKKADTGDESAINKLNFLRDGDSGEYNKHVNVFPEGGSVKIGKTYFVDRTPSQVEELMELPFFSPLEKISMNPLDPLGMLPGSPMLTNPFRLFKDPGLAMLPRGAEVRSRYDLDLSKYDPSLYPSNIKSERNKSPELEAIEKSKDGKKYREYQDETKRLMKEADKRRADKKKDDKKKDDKKKDDKKKDDKPFDLREYEAEKHEKFSNLYGNITPLDELNKKDFDLREYESRKNKEALDLLYPNVKKEKEVDPTGGDPTDLRNIGKLFGFNQGGPVFDNDNDTSNNDVDSVPAVLTPGEFVVTKDAVEKVGVDALEGLNASVGATNEASNLGSFSIKRLDPTNLSKDALIKKSSFANNIKDVEISNESGSDYFRNTTDMSTGGLSETTVKKTRFTETKEDGTVIVYDKNTKMTEKIVSIGVPDLIEHQDQLLGEIHKLKGFENVTIDQVVNQTTGIPQEKLLPILMRSDAQKATDEKEEKAIEEDRKARGIKPGQGFSMSANDEVAKSLAGTMGYRIGQINPDQLVSAMTNLREETKVATKTGVEPKTDSLFDNLSASINESVKGFSQGGLVRPRNKKVSFQKFNQGGLVKNNLQPIIQNKKESLDNNILASPNTDSEIQVLPPISSPQTSEIKDNAPVMAQPSQTPLPSTKELADTNSPVHFIDLISA